ncbi:acetyl-CoA carboxylase biotin carboxyl carrier protein [Flavobacteriaceae bacterium]|jgi:acetyl-CoA carboxylase biotin carboxyl carrier protein|nr:acetyl-CoA carboxylase biotin carboxyl carrier protein [Flavobacteriaceae bacterium]
MNIKDIQQLIKFVAKSGVSEVNIESKDLKIGIKTGNVEKPVVYSSSPTVLTQPSNSISETQMSSPEIASEQENDSEDTNLITIKSPIIGTFYRKPSPDKSNFVENGDLISEGDVLCVIEAMKLFNEIESEFSGKIVKILVDDASPVEFDQPLFLIDPS